MPFKKLTVIFGISVRIMFFTSLTRGRGDTVLYIIMNVKTLCVGLTKNKHMVGEYEDVSKKHAESRCCRSNKSTSLNNLSFKTHIFQLEVERIQPDSKK